MADMREVGPTFTDGAPCVEQLRLTFGKGDGRRHATQWLFEKCVRAGIKPSKRVAGSLADVLLFSALRDRLGLSRPSGGDRRRGNGARYL